MGLFCAPDTLIEIFYILLSVVFVSFHFLIGVTSSPTVSTSKTVSTLLPEHVEAYDDLASFHND